MRLGIFGGTFDPPHLAHLLLAETCLRECGLDEIRFIPASTPPHKQDAEISPWKQRVAMVEFATAGIPEFAVDQREVRRGGVNFTCDTLAEFKTEFPDAELFFLMGSDSLDDLPTWREPETIASLATIVAVNRGPVSSAELAKMLEPLSPEVQQAVQFVEMPAVPFSATELRQRVAGGQSIRFLTPRPVERYIAEHQLYQQ